MTNNTFSKPTQPKILTHACFALIATLLLVSTTIATAAAQAPIPDPGPALQKLGPNHPEAKRQAWRFNLEKRQFETKIEYFNKRTSNLADQRNELIRELQELDVTDAAYQNVIQSLQTERVELIVDLAGLAARAKAIEGQATVPLAQVNEKRMLYLKESVELLEDQFNDTKELFSTGSANQTEVNQQQLALREAQAKLAESEALLENRRSRINPELAATEIERAEKQARLTITEKLLKKYYAARTKIEAAQRLEIQYQREMQRLYETEDRLEQFKTEFELLNGPTKPSASSATDE